MPLRARSGSPSSVPSGPWAILPLAAAAAPAAAAATSSAGHARVHHRVGREGGVAGGNGGEVGDHTPRVFGAALRTLRDVVGGAHRAHEVEALLAVGALVLVEGHLFPTSRSATLRRRHCTAPRALKNTGAARKLILRSKRGRSSVGRAPPLHGGGQGFDSPRLHSKSRCISGIPTPNLNFKSPA